ncbi:MAG: hypothetical protein V4813_11300 [Gemmatimonadota bacterium]
MSASHTEAPNDRSAAFTGLIAGAIVVFIILLATVKLTNAQFAAKHGEQHAPEATK